MGSSQDPFASFFASGLNDRNKPMASMKAGINSNPIVNTTMKVNTSNSLNRSGSFNNVTQRQSDGKEDGQGSFRQNGNSPLAHSGSGNKLSGFGMPSQAARMGSSTGHDPLNFFFKEDKTSSPPMNSIAGSGGGGSSLSPSTHSQSGDAPDNGFAPEKSASSPDIAHSDSASNLDFFNKTSEMTSPEVSQPMSAFGFDMMDTSSTPPQPQPMQTSTDNQSGASFDLFNQSTQGAPPTMGMDFLSEDKSNNIFGSSASFTSIESDTNTGEDDTSNHANPDELGSFFQSSTQDAEPAESLSSIQDPLTRAELEALANEIRRNFQKGAKTSVVPDPWNPFGTSQDDMAEMEEKKFKNEGKKFNSIPNNRDQKQKINGGSSPGARDAYAPSSVPARTGVEENSRSQLSGESEERYKLRMQRLNRISSKLQDKEEEIKKQHEKERAESIEMERLHETRGAEIEKWAQDNKDIRSMLANLESIMWDGCGYKSKSQIDLIQAPQVKKAYLRAIMIIHPDKVKSVQAKYISGKIFHLLEQAYRTFQDQELV